MEAGLSSSSHQQQSENGISERSIPFTRNPTEASLTARCSTQVRENSMGPLTAVAKTVSALFTNGLPGPEANGARESFTASKTGATATALLAILSRTQPAISME